MKLKSITESNKLSTSEVYTFSREELDNYIENDEFTEAVNSEPICGQDIFYDDKHYVAIYCVDERWYLYEEYHDDHEDDGMNPPSFKLVTQGDFELPFKSISKLVVNGLD